MFAEQILDISTNYLMVFITLFILMFGLVLILAGAFTAYFGSGKSRAVGGILIAVGAIVSLAYLYYFRYQLGYFIAPFIINVLVILAAAAIGAIVAILVFLAAIMKT